MPPEETNIPEENKPIPPPPPYSVLDPAGVSTYALRETRLPVQRLPTRPRPSHPAQQQQFHTIHIANGRGPLPVPNFGGTWRRASLGGAGRGVGPAPVVGFAVHHPPPRQPTPRASREHELENKLAEMQAEIQRLRGVLAAMPEPCRCHLSTRT